jgi:hypothetical protein
MARRLCRDPAERHLPGHWDWVLSIVFLVITIGRPIFKKQSGRRPCRHPAQGQGLQQKHKGDQQRLREEMKLYQTGRSLG